MDRKDSHLSICLEREIDSRALNITGFDRFQLEHDALPEIKLSEVDLSCELFGRRMRAPLLIGAMTGGTEEALKINQRLAKAAEKCGVGMALGSQRKQLEDSTDPVVQKSYRVLDHAPDLSLLIGNIGAVQLNYGVGVAQISKLIESVGCHAFCFHLNPLQEAIQPEGDTDFSGLIEKFRAVIPGIPVPVLVKEVGSGISDLTAQKLVGLGLSGVETAGVGGTSWAAVEGLRNSQASAQNLGQLFKTWGTSTAESILNVRKHLPGTPVIASGGISNGIEIAKALALGAQASAMALPFLKAAALSEDAVVEKIESVLRELRTAMFVTGSKNIQVLRGKIKGVQV